MVEEVITIAGGDVETIMGRLASDRAFRARYCADPDRTLEAYLSPEEIRAIKTGDGQNLGTRRLSERWQELSASLCGPDPGP